MSERNEPPSLQNMFSQVLREIQSGINRLEQTVNQATQPNQAPQNGAGFPPVGEAAPPSAQARPQPQAAPKAPAKPYTGTRWEYKVVYVNFRGQISSEGDQAIIGRGERRSSFVREYLDELGQQGWELSGVSPLADTENSYFIFKRPATGEPSQATRSTQSSTLEEVEDNSGPVTQL
ncbi:MAG: hypothetical protein JWP00_2938 [Chloroflexi bacterium]|jgi:hypothetical protein|nr:hypothetical protein [Chloroflexota bacterium]